LCIYLLAINEEPRARYLAEDGVVIILRIFVRKYV